MLHLSNQFYVFEHRRRHYVVQMQIFGKESDAVFEKTAVYDPIVDLFQEGKLEVFILSIFHEYSLQHLYRAQF